MPQSSSRFSFSQRPLVGLCNQGGGGGRLVLPCGRELTSTAIVAGKTMDPRLDENEAELGILVLAVALEMLADRDGLLHGWIW
jgi:hypothetical protein